MKQDYTESELLKISKDQELLRSAVQNSLGEVLFKMEKKNILPDINLLLNLQSPLTTPFLFQFYHLSNSELESIKKTSSPYINKENVVFAQKSKKIIKDIVDLSLLPKKTDLEVFNENPSNPDDVANNLSNFRSFDLLDSFDLVFFKSVLSKMGEVPKDNPYFIVFFNHCIRDIKDVSKITFSPKEFNKMQLAFKEYRYQGEGCVFVDKYLYTGNTYSKAVVNDWAFHSNDFKDFPVVQISISECGINSPEVKQAFESIVLKAQKRGFTKEDYVFFSKIMPEDESEPMFVKNIYNQLIKEWGVDEIKRVFKNCVPAVWQDEDFEKPEVNKVLNEVLIKENGDLNTSLRFLFQDELLDKIYTPERIKYLVENINWNNFITQVISPSNRDLTINIFHVYVKILSYAMDNEISLYEKEKGSKNLPWGQIFSLISSSFESDFTKEQNNKLQNIFNELTSKDKFFEFERSSSIFAFFNGLKAYQNEQTILTDFALKYFAKNPTPNKFLLLELMGESVVPALKDLKLNILKSLHPQDVLILKEITGTTNDITGSESAPLSNAQTAFYKSAEAFKPAYRQKISLFFAKTMQEQPNLVQHLLNFPEKLLDGDSFLMMLSTPTNLMGSKDSDWHIFAKQYQEKHSDFIIPNKENKKYISPISELSDYFFKDKDPVLTENEYKFFLTMDSLIQKAVKKKNYDLMFEIENKWLETPFHKKILFLDKYVDGGDWRHHQIDSVLKTNLLKRQSAENYVGLNVFLKHKDGFEDFYVFNSKDFSYKNLFKTLIKEDLNKKQISFILEKYQHFNKGMALIDNFELIELPQKTQDLMKDIILNEKPELIVYGGITQHLTFSNEEVLSTYKKLLDKLDVPLTATLSIYLAVNNNKNQVFPEGEDFIKLVKYVDEQPLEKKFLFSFLSSHVLKRMEDVPLIIQDRFIENFNIPGGKIDNLNFFTDFISLVLFKDLLNLDINNPQNKELAKTYLELNEFMHNDSTNILANCLSNLYSAQLSYTIDGEDTVINIGDFLSFSRDVKNQKAREHFSEDIAKGLEYAFKENLDIKNLNVFLSYCDNNLFNVLDFLHQKIDVESSKKEANGNVSPFEFGEVDLYENLADWINNGLLNNFFSEEAVEKVIFRVGMANFTSKYGSSECLSSAEYVTYLNKDLIATVSTLDLKKKIDNLFNGVSFLDDNEINCSNNEFKL